ncbi:(Fe-S)-binding protein [Thiohalocapsa marina]|uniref:(Fe-S)-binding protein n=1 Tax=Thiohalocapsa marina TaxID=424902 RepID=A0A5M8FMV0_9GAMM|nr:(Fe-S)-binding protein [Thiohalocapsa marina]KAA6185814.1 (Fe-S)-binding protein [Thiohalocapsa marina]
MSARNRPDAVMVFGTCLIDLVDPEAGLAAMRLIRREGIRVRFPQAQTCCGQPAYNSGYRADARRVARQQLAALAGDEPVVVPSASCAGMLRHHYPRLFAGTADQALAEALAERVVELCDFLHRVLAVRLVDQGPPVTVALHQSCSARREMAVAPAAAALLRGLSQVTLVEPDHAHECCGFGGTFAVKEPEISAAMALDKAQAVAATGAELLVSQDCGCLVNLAGTAQKAGLGFQAQHIADFLWQRTQP